MNQVNKDLCDVDLTDLVETFRQSALHLIGSGEFWEIRVHGGNGKARIELIQQTPPVQFRHPPGQQITKKEKPPR